MPPGRVTVMSTVPVNPAGATTVIYVPPFFTLRPAATLVPNSTSVAPSRLVPPMVTFDGRRDSKRTTGGEENHWPQARSESRLETIRPVLSSS